MFLNDCPWIFEGHARLDKLYCFFQTFSSRLNYADRVSVLESLFTNVVCLVEVTMKTTVIECHVKVDDVTVPDHALVRYAVTDNLIE